MSEKLWKDCSKEEHDAVNKWNSCRKKVLNKYKDGSISKEQFHKANVLLYQWLRLIEEKYEEKNDD